MPLNRVAGRGWRHSWPSTRAEHVRSNMRVRLCVPDAAWRPVCASHRTLQSRSAAVYDENKRRRAALGAAGYAAEGAHKLATCDL